MNLLLDNRSKIEVARDNYILKNFKIPSDFQQFLGEINGGYFYKSAFHLFGKCKSLPYHDIQFINQFLEDIYKELTKGLVFFGEDIFGNLFAFKRKKVISLDIETAEQLTLASSFLEFIDLIEKDYERLTGCNLVASKELEMSLALGKRYCPKMPFILGGTYTPQNLVLKDSLGNLKFSASIAHQVFGLPEGTSFQIKIK